MFQMRDGYIGTMIDYDGYIVNYDGYIVDHDRLQ